MTTGRINQVAFRRTRWRGGISLRAPKGPLRRRDERGGGAGEMVLRRRERKAVARRASRTRVWIAPPTGGGRDPAVSVYFRRSWWRARAAAANLAYLSPRVRVGRGSALGPRRQTDGARPLSFDSGLSNRYRSGRGADLVFASIGPLRFVRGFERAWLWIATFGIAQPATPGG